MSDISSFQKKIARFCAWRDRSIHEVEEKLKDYGALPNQIPQIIDWLSSEKYLDEERFVSGFVRGKFNQNQWGKIRIRFELKNKKIQSALIESALAQIEDPEYMETLTSLLKKKWKEVKEDNSYVKKQKVMAFLARKGFEPECIFAAFDECENI